MIDKDISTLVAVIDDIFQEKLGFKINHEAPRITIPPLLLKDHTTLITFGSQVNRMVIITLDAKSANSLSEELSKKIESDSKDISSALNKIAQSIFIQIITKVFQETEIYKKKQFCIKTYDSGEAENIYFISTDVLYFKIEIEEIGNIDLFFIND